MALIFAAATAFLVVFLRVSRIRIYVYIGSMHACSPRIHVLFFLRASGIFTHAAFIYELSPRFEFSPRHSFFLRAVGIFVNFDPRPFRGHHALFQGVILFCWLCALFVGLHVYMYVCRSVYVLASVLSSCPPVPAQHLKSASASTPNLRDYCSCDYPRLKTWCCLLFAGSRWG